MKRKIAICTAKVYPWSSVANTPAGVMLTWMALHSWGQFWSC